jgi:hypothetical protein
MHYDMKEDKISFGIHCTTMKMQGIAITGIIYPQKSLSVVHICQLGAYRMQIMTIHKQFDGVQEFFGIHSMSEFTALQIQCKEWPLMVSYTP